MTNLVEEITQLTEEWYKFIVSDHHKDRDCHWYIETKWSYGDPPKYTIQHWGYLLDDITEEFPSYEEALVGLKETLKKEIKQYKDSYYE